LLEHPWTIADVEKEIRAQIQLAITNIPRISHISSHMGCTNMSPEIKALAITIAKEYGIEIDLEELGVKTIGYSGKSSTTEDKFQSFIKMLEGLKAGETYLFVDHPGFDSPELRAIHHIGYENVASDRQGVTDIWTSSKVKEVIKKLNIHLISYADLKKETRKR
jgi:predicted glycoside hydrolase/deacetylase ChbG (UPF0249 family)